MRVSAHVKIRMQLLILTLKLVLVIMAIMKIQAMYVLFVLPHVLPAQHLQQSVRPVMTLLI
jgi:hypothetical protein